MKDIQDTMELIVFWHKGQYRKSSPPGAIQLPYVFHPFDVARMVWNWGAGTRVMMKASMGHDLLEHAEEFGLPLKDEDVLGAVGEEAFSIIKELTFIPQTDSPAQEKREYMKTFKDKSVHALVIKLADRLCNIDDFVLAAIHEAWAKPPNEKPNNPYASKYCHKAKDLFEAFANRPDEVVAEFGPNVHQHIRIDVRDVYPGRFINTANKNLR